MAGEQAEDSAGSDDSVEEIPLAALDGGRTPGDASDAPRAAPAGDGPVEPVSVDASSGGAVAAEGHAAPGSVLTEAATERRPRRRRRHKGSEEVLKADAPPEGVRPFHAADRSPPLVTGCAFESSPGIKELLGTRFITKFLYDLGECPVFEPFRRFATVGSVEVVDGEDAAAAAAPAICCSPDTRLASSALWRKWIARYGPDAVRLQLLFLGALDRPARVDEKGIRHMARLIERIRRQVVVRKEKGKFVSQRMLTQKHLLIYTLTARLERWSFHTAVAEIMRFVRFLGNPETSLEEMDSSAVQTFILLLSPFAPRLASELWSSVGQSSPLEEQPWPVASEELVHPPEKEFLILVNGTFRDRMQQPVNTKSEKLESTALQREAIRGIVKHRKISKVIVVPQRLVSIVLEDAIEDGAARAEVSPSPQGPPSQDRPPSAARDAH